VRFIRQITRVIIPLARLGAGLAFAVMIVAVVIQVVGRIIGDSPVWTEELTRYALLYMVAFGAGLAFRTGDLVNVDVICESLPGKLPWLLRLVSALATAVLAIYLLPDAGRYVGIGRMQTAPAMGIRMDFVHVTVWLLLAVLGVFAVLRVVGMLAGTEDGRPEHRREE
jgi:TRAP-type C4-dicarboxylate transport system permease small subunit